MFEFFLESSIEFREEKKVWYASLHLLLAWNKMLEDIRPD